MLTTRWRHVTTTKNPSNKIKPVSTKLSPSIRHQHITKRMDCDPVNIISSSTSYFLPLLPSFTLFFFFFFFPHSLCLPLSLSVSSGSYLILLHQAVLLLLWGRLPGYQDRCAVVSASCYGDSLGSGTGRCDKRHERDVTHTLQYARVPIITPSIMHICRYMCAFINKHYVYMQMDYMSQCNSLCICVCSPKHMQALILIAHTQRY